MPNVIIADDHGLYRRGLRIALETAVPDVAIREADDIDAVLLLLENDSQVDLALVDLNMHGMMSFDVLRDLRESYPHVRFVVISASRSRRDVLKALASGLYGFICKIQPESEIVSAVRDVLAGRIYVPPLMAQSTDEPPMNSIDSDLGHGASSEGAMEMHRLTTRQRQVLGLMAEGMTNKEIARQLSIAEATTKIHAAALMRALGVRNRTEAAVLAKKWLNQRQ